MKIQCPAKINLTLEVLDRREDGYHALRSVMVPLELSDTLEIEASASFRFTCDPSHLETEDNLAVRAVRAIAPQAALQVNLRKEIPIQAGLGGGSSDAASALIAAMNGALGSLGDVDWVKCARTLGSDVPFFLAQSAALVEGTGERVTSAGAIPRWHVLVVKPPAAVSTATAYAALDRFARPSRPRSSSVSLDVLAALQRRDFERTRAHMMNDFHDVIVPATPEIARAVEALERAGAVRPLLCGSGSAVFALAETATEIERIDDALDLPQTFLRFRTAFRESGVWRG